MRLSPVGGLVYRDAQDKSRRVITVVVLMVCVGAQRAWHGARKVGPVAPVQPANQVEGAVAPFKLQLPESQLKASM